MEIPKDKSILIIIAGENYHQDILDIVKNLQGKKTCFVTINKGFDALIENFKKHKIDTSNFLVIDCITKTLVKTKSSEKCIFVNSPNALTEISLEIGKAMKSQISSVIVDSLSNLLIYHKNEIISRFVHDLIQKARKNDKTLMLIMSDKDKDSRLFKDIETLVDEVIEMK